MSKMDNYKIVFVRHGESEYNKDNRFCGWHDADLSPFGIEEAKNAGKMLYNENYVFDVAYTSVLKRAIKTMQYTLDALDLNWIPITKLNERMYGGLQGLNKSETAAKHGEDQVKIWRRSYDIPPPAIDECDPRWPGNSPQYKSGKRVLVAAHGNSIRAIVKFLDNIPDNEITELNIPTAIPLVYELDHDMKPIKHYYTADEATVAAAVSKVANQGKAK